MITIICVLKVNKDLKFSSVSLKGYGLRSPYSFKGEATREVMVTVCDVAQWTWMILGKYVFNS